MQVEQFESLVTRLGPALDPLGIVAFPDTRTWGVAIDEDTSILIDLSVDETKIVLSCELGVPPGGDRAALYELLLRHNYHWDQTGGVRLALDSPDGGIVQLADLAADGLDVPQLAGVVRVFADSARAWREIIRRPRQADRPAFSDHAGAIFIRA